MRSLAASIRPTVTRAAIAAGSCGSHGAGPSADRAQSSGAREAGQDPLATPRELADCLASGAARVSRHRRTGAVRYIGMDVGRTIVNPRPLDASLPRPESAARAYLSVCGSLFGLGDQSSELVVTRNLSAGANRRSRSISAAQSRHSSHRRGTQRARGRGRQRSAPSRQDFTDRLVRRESGGRGGDGGSQTAADAVARTVPSQRPRYRRPHPNSGSARGAPRAPTTVRPESWRTE